MKLKEARDAPPVKVPDVAFAAEPVLNEGGLARLLRLTALRSERRTTPPTMSTRCFNYAGGVKRGHRISGLPSCGSRRKPAVVDLIAREDAFAYFDFYGSPRVMHFLTRVGVSPRDGNVHYCLDLTCDIDSLRKLDDVELSARLKTEPRPIRQRAWPPSLREFTRRQSTSNLRYTAVASSRTTIANLAVNST